MKILTTAVVAGVVALSVMFTGPQLMTTSTAAAAILNRLSFMTWVVSLTNPLMRACGTG